MTSNLAALGQWSFASAPLAAFAFDGEAVLYFLWRGLMLHYFIRIAFILLIVGLSLVSDARR